MFDDDTIAFLESGCGLLVGTVAADGAPHAGRGWGLDVLDAGAGRLRLLLDAADEVTLANGAGSGAVAVTAAEVRTLRSLQLKGRVVGIVEAEGTDRARAARYCDELWTAVEETDGEPRELLEQLTPAAYRVALVEVTALFDQTPGPAAGASVGPA